MISWRHLWETLTTCKPYYHFPDKELHGTYSLNGDHQQRSRRRAAAYCPGEVSPNLYSSSGISHQIESGPRRTPQKNTAIGALKMCCRLAKKSLRRGRDRKTRSKTEDEKWQERGNEGMTGALSPWQVGSRASPH